MVGATGSIGESTLKVAAEQRIPLTSLITRKNHRELMARALAHGVKVVGLTDTKAAQVLRPHLPKGFKLLAGEKAVLAHIGSDPHSHVMMALVGNAGIRPALAAAEGGKVLLLANKESLVSAGDLLLRHVSVSRGTLCPVDSEHGAIWQCLAGERLREVQELWLTASGGPFRDWPLRRLAGVTVQQALNHPTWAMGPKITIDSATLMNKGLEVIEAQRLFGLGYDRIRVVIHPQSIVHSLVRFRDQSYKAQCGAPDMTTPILYALFAPRRPASNVPRHVAPDEWGKLTFEKPDQRKFPCLELAYGAGQAGGTAPCVLNAANEVAVAAFLEGRVGFAQIPRLVDACLKAHDTQAVEGVEALMATDAWARRKTRELLKHGQ